MLSVVADNDVINIDNIVIVIITSYNPRNRKEIGNSYQATDECVHGVGESGKEAIG